MGVNVIEKKMSGGKQIVRNTQQPDMTFSEETSNFFFFFTSVS